MKIFITISMLFVFLFCGCERDNQIQKEVSVQQEYSEKKEEKKPVLMTGELDEFHPRSRYESTRKTKLTNMGILENPPSFLTPDRKTAQEALDKPEFERVFIEHFNSNIIVKPSYPFDYENNIDALKRLYNSHHLNEVVNDKMSELEKLKALMVYTNTFMDGGIIPSFDTDIGPSAEIITKLRREKGIGGISKHYAALFCQLALSCGFNARIIGMHTVDDNGELLTHDVCEVFLNRYEKWAIFDAYQRATYYTRNGIPQSALELREIMLNENYRTLHVFSEFGDFSDVISVREKLLPRYKYIYMWRMNDILDKSPEGGSIPWQALYQTHLVWEDEYAPVAEGGFDKLKKFNSMDNPDYPLEGVRFVTHDRNDFYWTLNHVNIHIERIAEMRILVYFDTVTPNFKTFKISESGGVSSQSGNSYKLKNVFGEVTVRSINIFGMTGRVSIFTITP